jgi:hypothetical protein
MWIKGIQGKSYSRVERAYLGIFNAIQRKQDWRNKLKDPSIWSTWQAEARSQGLPYYFNDAVWELLHQELSWIASHFTSSLTPSAVGGVWQADGIISAEILADLKAGVKRLEDVPESAKDWHPGSNKLVLDLVHPSLFPLVYGQSRKLPGCQKAVPSLKYMGGGEVLKCPYDELLERKKRKNDAEPTDVFISVNYQWLPSLFNVSEDGKVVIGSYINNLHPVHHKGLYHTIERIFEKFIPLFEKVLDDLTDKFTTRRFHVPDVANQIYPSIDDGQFEDRGSDGLDPEDEEFKDTDGEINWDKYNARREEVRAAMHEASCAKIAPVTPQKWKAPEDWPHRENSLKNRQLQVIVKLANVVLDPKNPTYPGGSWHVEGMANERIVASGIYYYESENISESLLSFRKHVEAPRHLRVNRDENKCLAWYYGVEPGTQLNEHLGSVETLSGRCIAFPNLFQHQVQPFELLDKSKPGIRKILVFFLVDPQAPIYSTANIPPQQQEWYADSLRNHVPEFHRMPKDVVNIIVSNVRGCPMSLEEAKAHREKLMVERKFVVDATTKTKVARDYSLCEH